MCSKTGKLLYFQLPRLRRFVLHSHVFDHFHLRLRFIGNHMYASFLQKVVWQVYFLLCGKFKAFFLPFLFGVKFGFIHVIIYCNFCLNLQVEDLARLSFQTTPIYIDVDDGRKKVDTVGI